MDFILLPLNLRFIKILLKFVNRKIKINIILIINEIL